MGKESSDNRSDSDAKGEARMRRFEKRQKSKEEIVHDPNIKITTFWEKIGKDGSWEEKEYRIKINER